MNVVKLNTISLDGDTFIKKGNSSNTNPAPTRKYTGHADVEGLKAIGWDDEDIAYFQEHGVDWDEEEDMYHKVSDANKALYGVLNYQNISKYAQTIEYLPKIAVPTQMGSTFSACFKLIAIPKLDTSKVTHMGCVFQECRSLTSIPPLDTSKVGNMSFMFQNCYSLTYIPPLDTSNVTDMDAMFQGCHSLTSIPPLDTSNVKYMGKMFQNCYSLTSIPPLYINTNNVYNIFDGCCKRANIKLKNIRIDIDFYNIILHKNSVLYMINHEAATSSITLTLYSIVYDTLINDEEIIAALEAHPNVSLAK